MATLEPNSQRLKNRVRVLVVDDHPVVRKGLKSCLAKMDNLKIVGEAGDGREALCQARALLPDLILMDIDMPQMSGLAVTELLRQELPQIKILILSIHSQPDYVLRILQSGARGYVLKTTPVEELVRAIETVHGGGTYFSEDAARVALNQFVKGKEVKNGTVALTNREREVLVQIAEGLSNKEIASVLGVSTRTVETHRERIMNKLGIHNAAGLTKFAISRGLVSVGAKPPA